MSPASKKSTAGTVRAHIFKGASSSNDILDSLLNNGSTDGSKYEETPLPPDRLNALVEMSAHLRPQIEAYVVNVHSRGHIFKPVINFDGPESAARVRDAMFVELLRASQLNDEPLSSTQEPSDTMVANKHEATRLQARLELARATSFFSSCNPDGSFEDLRERTGQDMESTGNAYWEVLRSTKDDMPRHLIRVRAATVRIGLGPGKEVEVIERRKLTDLTHETVRVRRRFKRFTQLDMQGTPSIWFKEFGDPRLMSRKTGKYHANLASLLKADGKRAKPATEMFHFSIASSTPTSYGMPRWIGNVPGVLGSRELDETNLDYFISNAVPALALLVSGGRFGAGVEEKLKEFFEEEVRGRKATHKMVVLEAEAQKTGPNGPSQNPKLEFVPLRNAQVNDALFQTYDKNNGEKIRVSFRLPPSMTGARSFVLAELKFSEDQVFEPLRDDFDGHINKHFMPALGIFLWTFQSKGTVVRDAEAVGRLIVDMVREGVIVPDEARMVLSKITQEDFPPLNTIWSKQPMPLTLAVLGIKAGPAEAVREQGRQAGDPSPMEALVAELGLDMTALQDLDPDARQSAVLEAMSSNTPLGGGSKDE